MAIAFLKHTPVGKKTQQAQYTAAAHVRYISRSSATIAVFASNMPRNYHAAQRWLNHRENSIRSNGRVCDKLILALPREMTPEQGVQLVRRFADSLANRYDQKEERWLSASYYFTLQDWDSNNPHAHMIFVDADVKTGERVFRTSDKGSTGRIKALWEAETNRELERHGIDAEIHFGAAINVDKSDDLDEQELSQHPQTDTGVSLSTDNRQEVIPEEQYAPHCHETPAAEAPAQAETASNDNEASMDTPERLKHAVSAHRRAAYFKQTLSAVKASKAQIVAMEELHAIQVRGYERDKATLSEMERAERHMAEEFQKKHVKSNGGLAGMGFMGWKTHKRKMAEKARQELQLAEYALSEHRKNITDWMSALASQQASIRMATERMARMQADLVKTINWNGTGEELAEASAYYEQQKQAILSRVSEKDVEIAVLNGTISLEDAQELYPKLHNEIDNEKERE